MTGRLNGCRILVVEDEYFIAADMARALSREDATVVGPVGQMDTGLALTYRVPIDAAVLDVNLGSATTYPIADRLRETATPLIFVTGYDEWSMPAAYRDVPRLSKPFTMNQVIETLVGIVAGKASA